MELLQQFPLAKVLMTDNKPSLPSAQFKSFEQRCGLTLHYADPRPSTSNGQIERAHSTLIWNRSKSRSRINQSIYCTSNPKPFHIFINVTRRIKGHTRFVGKYVQGRRDKFRPLEYINSWSNYKPSRSSHVRLSVWTLRSRKQ